MRDLEEIFVLNSRNTITDRASASQINGTVLRARQLSNSLTSNADDAVTLDRFVTEVLPQNTGAPIISEDTPAPEPAGSIIAYHNGQTERGCGLVIQAANNGSVKSGYVPDIKISDILGDISQKSAKINTNVKNPSISEPSLGLIQVNSPFLSLPTRNVLPVSLFCSSIPTIEMSRAVPFVIARVISPRSPLSEAGKTRTLSLISMLSGPGYSFNEGTVDHDIITSTRGSKLPLGVLVPAGSTPGEQSTFGMEVFTSPQTLVNADVSIGARGTPILDKFKPVMSLNNVSISVTPAGQAAFAYKEATINITVHDRSRMQDVAQLIRPDQFGFNFIELEYGWAHPEDEGSRNPYASLINAFRQKELYTVISSNMSMGDNGSVSISVRCGLKGARDLLNMTPISDQWTDTTKAEQIFDHMTRVITDILADKEQLGGSDDIRYVETIRSVSKSGAGGNFAVSPESIAAIKSYISRFAGNSDPELKELRSDLVELFGEDGTGGEFKKVMSSASAAFDEKINAMLSSAELYEFGKINLGHAEIDRPARPQSKNQKRSYVTFGKLAACLLGAPLTTGNFAEVQLYFYTFNSDAGAMNGRNIAEFPIPASTLRSALSEAIKSDPKMPVKKIMRVLISLVNDASAPAYGIKGPPKLPEGKSEPDKDAKARNSANSEKMKEYRCKTPNFKKGMIEYMMDSIRIGDKPVLRVHFFDRRSTPNDEALYLLDVAMSSGGSSELLTLVNDLQQGSNIVETGTLKAAEQAGIVNVTDVKGKKSYSLNTNNKSLKTFIKRTVPSLTYGTPGSLMTSFSLVSVDMQDFETALLIQSANGTKVPGQPNTDSPQNDMQVYPMNINASMLGCPLIDYAQEFFIDMDTGTSIDNIYVVNGIRHEISPGSFKTDLELKLTRTTGANSAIDSKIRTLLKTIDDKTKDT